MPRFTLHLLFLFSITALGCANAPTAPVASGATSGLDCAQLGAQVAQAEAARHAALEREQNAWKVIVPFAVAARYATSKSAVADADERLAQLRAESTRQGCDPRGS